MTNFLILAIIGHLVGDYLLQTDWMAQNKKSHWLPCGIHCLIWTTSVCLFSGLPLTPLVFLFVCHYLQDRTQLVLWWMKLKSEGFTKPPLSPWSVIVVDNVWHIVQIWIACRFIAT